MYVCAGLHLSYGVRTPYTRRYVDSHITTMIVIAAVELESNTGKLVSTFATAGACHVVHGICFGFHRAGHCITRERNANVSSLGIEKMYVSSNKKRRGEICMYVYWIYIQSIVDHSRFPCDSTSQNGYILEYLRRTSGRMSRPVRCSFDSLIVCTHAKRESSR